MDNLSYWNYRIVKTRDGRYEMREIYYDQDHQPTSWIDATPVDGDDLEDIRGDMASRMEALKRPVLVETDEGLIPYTEDSFHVRNNYLPQR